MSWRKENISGRKRTSTHGIVRIPTTTTSNVNITGQLGVADTVLPFFSEIRGVNGITFKGTSTIENSEGLTDGVLRIEGGNSIDTSTFSIQLENGIKINGPFYQTVGSSEYNDIESGETLTGNYFSAPQHIFNGVGDTGICDVLIRGDLTVTNTIYDLSVSELLESLVIQNNNSDTTDISSAFTIYHSKDAYGNIMSVYLDNVKNVDSVNTTSNYLANSAFIIDGEDYKSSTGEHIGYQGSTDQPGHVRMFRGATILKSDIDGNIPNYNKSVANTNHTLDVYGGVYLFDGVGTDNTHLTISGESPEFLMYSNTEGTIATIDNYGNMFLKGDVDICGGLQLKDDLDVSGSVLIKKNLSVEGNTLIDGYLDVSKNANISGNLLVTGTSYFNSDVSINDNLIVKGLLDVSQNVNIKGNLIVDNTTIIDGSLNVNNDVNILGNFTANNQDNDILDISGSAKIGGNFTVDGNVEISNNLTVDGLVSFSELPKTTGNVNFEENVFIEGDLSINQSAIIDGSLNVGADVSINGLLTVNNDVNILGTLSVDGKFETTSDISLTGDLKIQDDLSVNGNIDVSGNLTVDEISYLKDASMSGDLTVLGELNTKFLNIDGSVNIKSDATFTENLFVNQDVTVNNDLLVNNNSQINGNLVTSTGIVNKDLTVLGSVYVDKDVSFNIDLSVNNTLFCYNLDVCGEIIAKNITIENLDLDDLNVDNFECTNIDISNLLIVRNDLSINRIFVDDKAYFNNFIYTEDISSLFTHIVDTLTVSGEAFIHTGNFKDVIVSNDISVNGNISVDGSFIVNTLSLVNAEIEKLIVTDLTKIDGSMIVRNNVVVENNAFVAGNITNEGNVNIAIKLNVSGNAFVLNTVNVTGGIVADTFMLAGGGSNRLVITDDNGNLTTSSINSQLFDRLLEIIWGSPQDGDYSYTTEISLLASLPGKHSNILELANDLNNMYINSQDVSGYLTIENGGVFIIGDGSGNKPSASDCSAAFFMDPSGANIGYSDKLYLRELTSDGGNGVDKFIFDASGSFQFLNENNNDTVVIGEIENLETSVKFKTTSDRRLKTNIETFPPEDGLEYCMNLRPRRFEWKQTHRKDIGFIAQEIAENNAVPEFCKSELNQTGIGYDYPETNGKPDYYTVDYSSFTPITISAIQKLHYQLKELEDLVNKKLIKD